MCSPLVCQIQLITLCHIFPWFTHDFAIFQGFSHDFATCSSWISMIFPQFGNVFLWLWFFPWCHMFIMNFHDVLPCLPHFPMIFFHNFSPNSAWCHHVVQPVAEGCHGRWHWLTKEGLDQPGTDPGSLREIGDVFIDTLKILNRIS